MNLNVNVPDGDNCEGCVFQTGNIPTCFLFGNRGNRKSKKCLEGCGITSPEAAYRAEYGRRLKEAVNNPA